MPESFEFIDSGLNGRVWLNTESFIIDKKTAKLV